MEEPVGAYLIFGEDDYLVEKALEKVLSRIERHAGSLTVETVDCRESGIGRVIEEMLSPSLFSINKVTVLKNLRLSADSKLTSEVEKCLEESDGRSWFVPGCGNALA